MENSLAREILKHLCYHRERFLGIVGLLAVLWVLTLVGLVVIPPGTGAYAISVFNLVGLSVFLVAGGAMVTVCFKSDVQFQ